MADTIHYTRFELQGPWLIDDSSLQKLDKALVETTAILRNADTTAMQAKVDADSEDYSDDAERRSRYREQRLQSLQDIYPRAGTPIVEFLLEDKRIVRGESIAELIRQSDIAIYRTVAVQIEQDAYPYLNLKFSFALETGKVSIAGTPSESSHVNEAFNVLRKWAVEHRPPRWQCIWKELSAAPLILAISIFGAHVFSMVTKTYDGRNTAAAQALLQKGIDSSNIPQAIDLLLRAQFDLPAAGDVALSAAFPIWSFTLFLVGLILYFGRPRSAIGIGPTLNSPANWRWWIKIASSSFPLWILGRILTPIILEWIRH